MKLSRSLTRDPPMLCTVLGAQGAPVQIIVAIAHEIQAR